MKSIFWLTCTAWKKNGKKKLYDTNMHKIWYTYVFPKHKSQSSNVPSLTIWKMMTKQTADLPSDEEKGGNATITIW